MQQREADVVQPLDLAGVVVETLERPAADVPRTHQAALDLSFRGAATERKTSISVPALGVCSGWKFSSLTFHCTYVENNNDVTTFNRLGFQFVIFSS